MGKTDIYGPRVLVVATLTPAGSPPLPYGFLTNVEAGERTPLGLTIPAAGAFMAIGANLPKPTRMIKKDGGYTVSSFASTGSIQTAIGAKWRIQKPGRRYRHSPSNALESGTGSVSAYVEVDLPGANLTIKYAWRMPRQQAAKMEADDFTELGITVPTTDNDARDMMFGINNLKPARAAKTVGADGESASFTLSTFCSSDATLTSWTPLSSLQVKSAKPEF